MIFAHQVDPLVGELVAGLVGVVDGAVHAVAEAEMLREADGDVAETVGVGARPDPFHDGGMVLRLDDGPDLGLESEPLAEIGLLHCHKTPRSREAKREGQPAETTPRTPAWRE